MNHVPAHSRIRLAIVCSAFASSSLAAEWPQFRGPDGNGHAGEADVPLEWSETRNVAWKTPLPGPGSSSPIVAGDRVFLACYSGYGLDAAAAGEVDRLARHAVCLDLSTGKVLWDHATPNRHRETPFTGPYITRHGYASSTPVTDGERVYYFHGASGVFAYTRAGEPVWETSVGEGVHAWGTGASPILFGNLVIVNASAESDSLVALDKSTGDEVWRVRGMPRSWNTPLLVDREGGATELVVSVRGRVRGLDPTTGTELWSCKGIDAAELCPSPVEHGGIVFVLGHPRGEAMAVRAGGRGDVTASHVLWRLPKGSNVVSPVAHAGHLYWMSDKKGVAYCVEGETGKVVYEQRVAPNPGTVYASPVLVGDRLYFTSRESGTFVVAAEPEYRVLAHNTLSPEAGPFNGSPAVADGRLLLRSDRFLYCIASE